jgi:hypothetical protein
MNVRDRFEKNVEIREPRKEHGERTMKGTDCEMGRKKSISTGCGSSYVLSLPPCWAGGNFWGSPPIRGIRR